jgi:hypothetical protein
VVGLPVVGSVFPSRRPTRVTPLERDIAIVASWISINISIFGKKTHKSDVLTKVSWNFNDLNGCDVRYGLL